MASALAVLAGQINDSAMSAMNFTVDQDVKRIRDVGEAFLRQRGLLQIPI